MKASRAADGSAFCRTAYALLVREVDEINPRFRERYERLTQARCPEWPCASAASSARRVIAGVTIS